MRTDNGKETESLYQRLSAYARSDFYPCHMPGHKRNPAGGEMADFYKVDITEIDGFDNLHQARGILLEAQLRANRLYGADETYFLVNGSTCGILAAIMAVTKPGDKLLAARNCHKSVYHAAILQELTVHYCQPGLIREYDICDGILPAAVGRLLDEHPDAKAVVITSPTYEGIVSDIAGIADTVHGRDKILIVDEAHGAHLGLFPETGAETSGEGRQGHFAGVSGALASGADLVIHSLHKTLPSMTQTALLHVNGGRVDRGRLRRYLTMVQSSSPSYVLMASMDSCVRFLEKHGEERFAAFQAYYKSFCKKTESCRHIRIAKMTDVSDKGYALRNWDAGKLVISVRGTGLSGPGLYDILREKYHLQMEMAAESFVLAMMTLMDTEEGWQRLADALCEIDDRIERGTGSRTKPVQEEGTDAFSPGKPEAVMTLAQAFHSGREEVTLGEAAGRTAADFINLYPPGIPLAAPGEMLGEALIQRIIKSRKTGLPVQGVSEDGKVAVVAAR